MKMAAKKTFTVEAPAGKLNVREGPSKDSMVIAQLPTGSKIKIDPSAEVPDGWKAVESGGYVMGEFLK